MKMKLGSVVALVWSAMAMLAVGAPAAGATETECESIKGAGSSLQNVAQKEVWISLFTGVGGWWVGLCKTDPHILYASTSSGKGKAKWGYKKSELDEEKTGEEIPDYIGTDVAPTKTQIENMNAAGGQPSPTTLGVISFPVAQSAISVIVSLPEGCEPETPAEPAEIKGTTLDEEWEKGAKKFTTLIENELVGASCAASPALKARSSSSGTTAGFKRYFHTLLPSNTEWNALGGSLPVAEEAKWPPAVEASGNFSACCSTGGELAEKVLTTPGTVGYADLADAIKAGFSTSWTQHTTGGKTFWSVIAKIKSNTEFESPEEASGGGSNCKKVKYKEENTHGVAPGEDWSEVKQENVAENGAYPICTLTFDLAWNHYGTTALASHYCPGVLLTCEHIALAVLHFFHAILLTAQGQGAHLLASHYGALPAGIQEKALHGDELMFIQQ